MRKIALVFLMLGLALAGCSSKKTASTTPTSSGSPTASSPAGGTNAGSAFCQQSKAYNSSSDEISSAFRNIDFSNLDRAKQQLADAYRALAPKFKQQYDSALRIAPSEIKADLDLLGTVYVKFLDALAKVDYDFTKIGSDANLSTAFTQKAYLDAADRVGRYFADKCGIPYTPIPRSS